MPKEQLPLRQRDQRMERNLKRKEEISSENLFKRWMPLSREPTMLGSNKKRNLLSNRKNRKKSQTKNEVFQFEIVSYT